MMKNISLYLLIAILPFLSGCNKETKSRKKPPNVLFIAIDDLNNWIRLLDDDAPITTPHLEELAQKGMLFTKAYAPSASCNPSRVAILTGMRPSTTGVYGNKSNWKKALPDVVTIPEYFKQEDYKVMGAGKIFHHHWNGAFHDSSAFDDFQHMPWLPDSPMPEEKLNGFEWYGSPNTDWGIWPEDEGQQHLDQRTTAYVVDKLDSKHSKPFFLAAGIFRPHMPFFAPADAFEKYPEDLDEVQMPEVNWNDWDDIPSGAEKMVGKEWLWNGMMKADSIRPGAWKEAVRAYQVCATFADKQIGKIIAALKKSPYAENTIIVLWSDHGFHLGEKEHWEKFALWEKTTQVPFIVVAPGVTQPGTVYESPVNLLDIYPTLLDLCGFEETPELDGKSLVNVLKDPEYERNRPSLMTYGKGNHAIRTDRWRYIHYKDGTEELYDHRNDPREWNNLAGDDQYENLKDSLKQWLPKTEADSVPDMKRPEDL